MKISLIFGSHLKWNFFSLIFFFMVILYHFDLHYLHKLVTVTILTSFQIIILFAKWWLLNNLMSKLWAVYIHFIYLILMRLIIDKVYCQQLSSRFLLLLPLFTIIDIMYLLWKLSLYLFLALIIFYTKVANTACITCYTPNTAFHQPFK